MKKKCILFFLFNSLCFSSQYCAFCDPEVIGYQSFYEGELILALCTHKPVLPGHCLIIPKRHVERFEMLTDSEILEIGQVIRKVNQAVMQEFQTISYLLLQKNGQEAGQTVPHVHFHYIPRKEGDDSAISFMLKMLIANLKKPLQSDEMEGNVQKIKHAMQQQ